MAAKKEDPYEKLSSEVEGMSNSIYDLTRYIENLGADIDKIKDFIKSLLDKEEKKPKQLGSPLEHIVQSNGQDHRVTAIPENEYMRRTMKH